MGGGLPPGLPTAHAVSSVERSTVGRDSGQPSRDRGVFCVRGRAGRRRCPALEAAGCLPGQSAGGRYRCRIQRRGLGH
eukprot:1458011-Alexandrium_andersonii.AAC.1